MTTDPLEMTVPGQLELDQLTMETKTMTSGEQAEVVTSTQVQHSQWNSWPNSLKCFYFSGTPSPTSSMVGEKHLPL